MRRHLDLEDELEDATSNLAAIFLHSHHALSTRFPGTEYLQFLLVDSYSLRGLPLFSVGALLPLNGSAFLACIIHKLVRRDLRQCASIKMRHQNSGFR